MFFNIQRFVMGKIIAANQGVSDQRATQLGLLGSVLPMGLVPSVLVTQIMAQNESSAGASTGTAVTTGTGSTPTTEMVSVPDVRTRSADEAEGLLLAGRFSVQIAQQASETVPLHQVISQNPAAGRRVPVGTTVVLIVSAGKIVTVPNVTNQTTEAAEKTLTDLKLLVEKEEANSETVGAGLVISQDPAAGDKLLEGRTVQLVISLGSSVSLQEVPNVVNMPFGQARELLQDGDFRIQRVNEASETRRNLVIRQEPAGTTMAAPESLVTLYVSTGTPPQTGPV